MGQFINGKFHCLQGDDSKKGKKKKSDLIELPFDSELPGNTEVDLQRYRDEEVSLKRWHSIFMWLYVF